MEGQNLRDSEQHPEGIDELSPLIHNLDRNGLPSREEPVGRMLRGPFTHILLFAVFSILIEAGGVLETMPLSKVLEGIICDNVTERSGEPVSCGKDERVQGELALLRGYRSTIALIPGLVMAIPYGIMAKTYGHRVVMFLGALGIFADGAFTVTVCWWSQAFKIQMIWLSPLFTFVGGGSPVLSAMCFASLSELSTEASRATLFAYFGGIDLGARLVLSILAANMMERNVWVPICSGLGCSAASVVWSLCLPKTSSKATSRGRSSSEPIVYTNEFTDSRGDEQDTFRSRIQAGMQNNSESIRFLFKQATPPVLVLMFAVVLTSVGWGSLQPLPQLARKRFGWSWSHISYLVSLETGECIAVLVALVPAASFAVSTGLSMSALSRDVVLIRASCLLVASGAVIVGASRSSAVMMAGLFIFYLGAGYNVILRSLLAILVEGNAAMLFNCVALLEMAGSLISGPLMAELFKAGLSLGGVWVGLPFFFGASLCAAAFLTLSAAKFPAKC